MESSMSMFLASLNDDIYFIEMALRDKSVGARAMLDDRISKDYKKQVRWLTLYIRIRKRQFKKLGHCWGMIGGRGGPH